MRLVVATVEGGTAEGIQGRISEVQDEKINEREEREEEIVAHFCRCRWIGKVRFDENSFGPITADVSPTAT